MSGAVAGGDDALDRARVARATERLDGPLGALVEALDRAGHDGAAGFFRAAREQLRAAVTPQDLQAVFIERLAPSGPVALRAGVGPIEIGMLDDLLALAQEISLAFMAPSEGLH